MQSSPTINLLRTLFVVFAAFIGWRSGETFWGTPYVACVAGIAVGLTVVLADHLLKGFSLRLFSSATFGLILGFLAARLLLASGILFYASEDMKWLIGLTVYATFSYIGMMLAVRSNRDEFAFVIPYVRFRRESVQDESPMIVDSNIIIDGRLPELAKTGFISTSFVIPHFVLEELQTLADSHDPLKRERGKLALARLQDMQNEPGFSVTITGSSLDPFAAVDSKLVQLAKMTNARLLTNDGNLCSIARMQGVTALNLNDLTKALRPVLSTGDEIDLVLAREGRDSHQAVGYLNDGTMIVVNHARAYLGKSVKVSISSVLQTSAGRLFFAELKAAA
jgi:uncharacterized protein YacL